MDRPDPPEFILDVFADPRSVRDVVKGILHTIFFTRFFPALVPRCRNVLDLTLPYVDDDELETMIDQRAAALERQLLAQRSAAAAPYGRRSSSSSTTVTPALEAAPPPALVVAPAPAAASPAASPSAAAIVGAAGGRGQVAVQFFEKRPRRSWLSRADEEVCWECWTVKVTVAEPRTEAERAKVRRAMEQTLHTTAMKIVTFANAHKDHIPPITTHGGNPFPFKINVDHADASRAPRTHVY